MHLMIGSGCRVWNHVCRSRTLDMIWIRSAFRRPDTPAPAPDLAEKVLFVKKQYMEREAFPGEFALAPARGRIYDKKPFPIYLEAGRQYSWCTCGHSKSQPICDGTHKRLDGTEFVKKRPLFRPLVFTVPESSEYHLCNCKQTNNRPFCDGTHRRSDIQEAVRS